MIVGLREVSELRAVTEERERPGHAARFRLLQKAGRELAARTGLVTRGQHAAVVVTDACLHDGELLGVLQDLGLNRVVGMVLAEPEDGVGGLEVEPSALDRGKTPPDELRHRSAAVGYFRVCHRWFS